MGGEPFVVYNGDILCDLPLEAAMRHHLDAGNEVTMVLRSAGGPLTVALDKKTGRIADIAQRLNSGAPAAFLFTGIYVVSPYFFTRIPARIKVPVVPIFLEMIRQEQKLGGVVVDNGHWWDLGTREQYLAANRHVATGEVSAGEAPGISRIHPTAKISVTAKISAATAIGANAVVGENACLNNCIIWENAHIAPGSVLENCIISTGRSVEGTHRDEDF